MNWQRTIAIVTACALLGMALGGLFGFAAGTLTPSFFAKIVPWQNVEPRGFAVMLGAFGGVFLGGGLGIFALIIHLFTARKGQTK